MHRAVQVEELRNHASHDPAQARFECTRAQQQFPGRVVLVVGGAAGASLGGHVLGLLLQLERTLGTAVAPPARLLDGVPVGTLLGLLGRESLHMRRAPDGECESDGLLGPLQPFEQHLQELHPPERNPPPLQHPLQPPAALLQQFRQPPRP
eukprot:CAMPEP_0116897432 /NCGR_PEP_ID=MMETSP0467-20121206/6411_1 /TAXON_ID=283647 /ORGANISM="Mesodinium pulex, Strain SPMC105" /LENGTH=150 /DNA_ID=CAMNT_0004569067 /DNA_START=2226 /DNA_END=2678 /DNA_ORIENTATION=-